MRFKVKSKIIILLIIVCLLISGCNGATETDETAYIMAIGIDKSPIEGMVEVTYQIALHKILGEGGESKELSRLVTMTTPSLAEARNLLSGLVVFQPTMVHVKTLIVGEELARKGVLKSIGPLKRFREFRGSMFVLVAKGTAKEFLEAIKPPFEITPAKYYEVMMATSDDAGYYMRTSLHQFYGNMKSGSAQPYAALVGVNNEKNKIINEGPKIPGQKLKAYTAGNVPRKSDDPAEFMGTAVFKGDKMVGMLTNQESRAFHILLGVFREGYITVQDPLAPEYGINILLRLGKAPKIKTRFEDNIPVVDVKVELEGDVTSIASGVNYELPVYGKLLENHISEISKKEIMHMIEHTQKLNSDVVGFGYYFRPFFTTREEWRNYKWHNVYAKAKVNVEVKTKIRRTSLMWRTAPVIGGTEKE